MPKKSSKAKKAYPEKLFTSRPADLVWGVTVGGHVSHLIDPREAAEGSYSVIIADPDTQPADGYKKVTPAETFSNIADSEIGRWLRRLAEQADELYSAGLDSTGKDAAQHAAEEAMLRDALLALKAYVTAGGRRARQSALSDFIAKTGEFCKSEADPVAKQKMANLCGSIIIRCSGGLDPGQNTATEPGQTEPANRFIGVFGSWTPTNDALFPHGLPSPNDIKQGYGVNDCFLMSSLTRLAMTDPMSIYNNMKDNGNGTVNVRFSGDNPKTKKKEQVLITVNKTVNRIKGSGYSPYASSALWVQMMEKAMIEYLYRYVKIVPGTQKQYERSFTAINYGHADQALNALSEDKTFSELRTCFGFAVDGARYSPKASRDREYTEEENELFDFLSDVVTVRKEPVIVGNSGMSKANKSYALDHGVRAMHAYPVMKVFEAEGKKFVQLRDPYAVFRAEYDKNRKLTNGQAVIGGTYKAGLSNMATFNLELKDFLTLFDSVSAMTSENVYRLGELTDKWAERRRTEAAGNNGPRASDHETFEEFVSIEEDGTETAVKVRGETADARPEDPGFDDFVSIEEDGTEKPVKTGEPEKNEVNEASPIPDGGNEANAAAGEKSAGAISEERNDFADEFEQLDTAELSDPAKESGAEAEFPDDISLENLLSHPEGVREVARVIAVMAEDLESTSMFFSYKNTQAFNDMRDKLNDVNRNFRKGVYDPGIRGSREALEQDIDRLANLAGIYAAAKSTSIIRGLEGGSRPSLRAVHRLADAVTLMNLRQGLTDMAIDEESHADQMRLIRNDMISTYEALPKGGKRQEHLEKAWVRLHKHIQRDPMLKSLEEEILLEEGNVPAGLADALKNDKASKAAENAEIKTGAAAVESPAINLLK